MVEIFDITLPPLTGEEKRKAYVYTPEERGTFPVLYMFDGHNLFDDNEATYGRSWRLGDFLKKNKIPLIIAAAECNHKGNCRLEEYSPFDFTFNGCKLKGKGKKYLKWLTESFKPFIDGNYPTVADREHTFIGGSSMGGLMTLYAVAKYNKIFSKGAALSPSLWVADGAVLETLHRAKFANGTAIYTDYGSLELKNSPQRRQLFGAACAAMIEKGVNLTARVAERGAHNEESWERSIPYFIKALGL